MKEIGGYLELEETQGKEYYPTLIALNSACNALTYLLKARKIKRIFLPYYLCNSVANACINEGCSVEYYHIHQDFTPIFKKELSENEYIYIVNFFGQIDNKKLEEMQKLYKHIIVDNVQAFFQQPIRGIDTLYSCRKFFGVPDGAYLSTDAFLEIELETDISINRMKHILGRYDTGCASDFYADYQTNEHEFLFLPLRYMSKLTHHLLKAIDYEAVRQKRNKNYDVLEKALGALNSLKVNRPEGAFMYPFYCEDGMRIKRELAQRKIYVPTLWPNVLQMGKSLETEYAENIIPLPIDQRYKKEDMEYMIRALREAMAFL